MLEKQQGKLAEKRVSIRTPEAGVDIYEPMANQVQIPTAVPA